jgi:probable rRNA maturation factor
MILNNQRQVRVAIGQLEAFAAKTRRALRLSVASCSICLVTRGEIAKWNRAYRGKNKPTDVLSFPSEEALARATRRRRLRRGTFLGDIAICPAVARKNAARFGRTPHQELCILVLHGMLHLMGYDHEKDAGQMDRREARLRKKLGLT